MCDWQKGGGGLWTLKAKKGLSLLGQHLKPLCANCILSVR